MSSRLFLTPKPTVPALVRSATVLGAAVLSTASLVGCGSPPMPVPTVPDSASSDAGADAFIAPMPPDGGGDAFIGPMPPPQDAGEGEDAGTDSGVIAPMPPPRDAGTDSDVIAPMPPPMPPPMPAP